MYSSECTSFWLVCSHQTTLRQRPKCRDTRLETGLTRFVIVGGGIVGLATARAIQRHQSSASVLVVEKESGWASHQTGRNSGVIHSGIYYPPGSAKARMCRAGARSMIEFTRAHGIAMQQCGKLIVATAADELGRLDALYQRGIENGIEVERVGPDGAREVEPHVQAVAGLRVAATAITDYRQVSAALAAEIEAGGGELQLDCEVIGASQRSPRIEIETTQGQLNADIVVNCAGVYSDRIATMLGAAPQQRIVPFRGEYYELKPERSYLVNGLIYPVPNPDFPFLGVHLTRMVDGSVHAGPNAVLALSREGYDWGGIRPRDVASTLGYPGFWRLARANYREGGSEMLRSFSKRRFAASLATLVPEITADDLLASTAGVRAQALTRAGALVDDFLIVEHERSINVLNAPSPAATSSLEIGEHVARLAISAA